MIEEILCNECRARISKIIDVKNVTNPEARALTIMTRIGGYMNDLRVLVDHNLFKRIKGD